ncbi:MAG: 30S ribosomal protein S8 [Chloroflexi bacterium]|nr:30S ribosomal protein S8 [Chloroflexota bacterium]
MPVSDPVADMLTRLRNAVQARHVSVVVPGSRTKAGIAQILKKEGLIQDFETMRGDTPQSVLRIHLGYDENKEPRLRGMRRISKPGLRVYVQKGEIPRVYGGLGVAILSTSAGLLTGQEARRRGLGGELLCYVW